MNVKFSQSCARHIAANWAEKLRTIYLHIASSKSVIHRKDPFHDPDSENH